MVADVDRAVIAARKAFEVSICLRRCRDASLAASIGYDGIGIELIVQSRTEERQTAEIYPRVVPSIIRKQ